jgi:iron-sulfur cluster repair protein YtfE (RIC family)
MSRLDELRFMAATVAKVHGYSHPDMITLNQAVSELAQGGSANPGELQARIARLTGDYTPWPGACATVAKLFGGLREATRGG